MFLWIINKWFQSKINFFFFCHLSNKILKLLSQTFYYQIYPPTGYLHGDDSLSIHNQIQELIYPSSFSSHVTHIHSSSFPSLLYYFYLCHHVSGHEVKSLGDVFPPNQNFYVFRWWEEKERKKITKSKDKERWKAKVVGLFTLITNWQSEFVIWKNKKCHYLLSSSLFFQLCTI